MNHQKQIKENDFLVWMLSNIPSNNIELRSLKFLRAVHNKLTIVLYVMLFVNVVILFIDGMRFM